jgi:hypothetical protein
MCLRLFLPVLLLLATAAGRHVTGDIDGNDGFDVDDLALDDVGLGEEDGEDGGIQCGLSKINPYSRYIWNGQNADKFEHPWQVFYLINQLSVCPFICRSINCINFSGGGLGGDYNLQQAWTVHNILGFISY